MKTLLEAKQRLPAPEHVCSIYREPSEQLAYLVPFLRAGLERGEQCLYIAENKDDFSTILAALNHAGDAAVRSRALILSADLWNRFQDVQISLPALISLWRSLKANALGRGYTGMRAAIEMNWILGSGLAYENWMGFERRLAIALAETGCTALCQYDHKQCAPSILLSAIRSHQVVVCGETPCENFYFIPPEDFGISDFTAHEVERRLRNLRDREHTVRDLKHTENQLREITGRVMASQEEERRRIARELHDSTAQQLTGIRMTLGTVKRAVRKLDSQALQAVAECQEMADRCAREIRTLSYLLHPPLLDEFGLLMALRGYIEGFGKRSGLRVTLEADARLEQARFPRDLETTLFRIVQESLTNVNHHSGSFSASVCLKQIEQELFLSVRDHGRGIDPAIIAATGRGDASSLGVGLPGMRERVRQLGGQFQLESGAAGTSIMAVFPLNGSGAGFASQDTRAIGIEVL